MLRSGPLFGLIRKPSGFCQYSTRLKPPRSYPHRRNRADARPTAALASRRGRNMTAPAGDLDAILPKTASACRRIEMPHAFEILHLEGRLGFGFAPDPAQIGRADRRLAVTTRNVEHIARLAQAGQAAVQRSHEHLALCNGRAQVCG